MVVNVVSFFSGCGGSSLGYQMAGCKVMLACDFEESAMKIYRKNFPHTATLVKDIRAVRGLEISGLTGISRGELDILDGSPPCTPFSTCGLRERGWGRIYHHSSETKAQASDDLFFEFIRLIGELKPKTFVAENVAGMVRGSAKGYFNQILRGMKSQGYDVDAFMLNARNFGVAQNRERVIFIGIRDGIRQNEKAKFVREREISFMDATRGLMFDEAELKAARDSYANSISHGVARLMKAGQTMIMVHPNNIGFNCRKCRLDKPIGTITTHTNQLSHPTESRFLVSQELKRCSSYPDDFWFPNPSQVNVRIGNSVPPRFMMHIAEYVVSRANLRGQP